MPPCTRLIRLTPPHCVPVFQISGRGGLRGKKAKIKERRENAPASNPTGPSTLGSAVVSADPFDEQPPEPPVSAQDGLPVAEDETRPPDSNAATGGEDQAEPAAR